MQLTQDAEERAWWANVAAAASIPGFDPHGHSGPIWGINYSGKDLHNANLSGIDLHNVQMRDTDLSGANLSGANLVGANLEKANLTNADLSHAKLQGANFYFAQVEHVKSLNEAVATDKTCWPRAFLDTELLKPLTDGLKGASGQPPTAEGHKRGRMDGVDGGCIPREKRA